MRHSTIGEASFGHLRPEYSSGRAATIEGDDSWTTEQFSEFIFELRTELEAERRAAFLPLGVPSDCLWPASRIFHEHSRLSPAWLPALSLDQVDELTRNLGFKSYPGAARIALPRPKPIQADLAGVIRRRRSRHEYAARPVGFDHFARLLDLGCGVTEDGPIPRRGAPSAGALYPVETYALALRVDGVAPGIYHYAALDHALETVGPLDGVELLRPCMPSALFQSAPPLIITLSVVFERTQLKYLERGYRFALLEAGHIAQNLLLIATSLGLNSLSMGGFMDDPFNAMLQFDTDKEAVVYAVLIGQSG